MTLEIGYGPTVYGTISFAASVFTYTGEKQEELRNVIAGAKEETHLPDEKILLYLLQTLTSVLWAKEIKKKDNELSIETM